MNQSDRTLNYHLHTMKNLLDLVWPAQTTESLGGTGGTRQEYDPNQQAERVELRCPVCGRRNCPLDVRRGM